MLSDLNWFVVERPGFVLVCLNEVICNITIQDEGDALNHKANPTVARCDMRGFPYNCNAIFWMLIFASFLLSTACKRTVGVPAVKIPAALGIQFISKPITVGKMAGYVVTNDGYPIPGVYVELLAENKFDVLEYVITDGKGKFKFRRIPDGDYWIRISKEGWTTVIYAVKKTASSKKELVIATDVRL